MKRSRFRLTFILLFITATIFLAAYGCVHAELATAEESAGAMPEAEKEENGLQTNDASAETPLRGQLLCAADSQEEAEQIAKQYGITLVSYAWGIAEYWTEENPQEVIAEGLQQGWIELSLNGVSGLE